MQLTVKREILLLGKKRKAGESISFEVGDKVGQLTDHSLRALLNMGAVEVDGMVAEAGASAGIVQHLRAKTDKHEERIKDLGSKLAVAQQANDDMAVRQAAQEDRIKALEEKLGVAPPPAKATRREQRKGK